MEEIGWFINDAASLTAICSPATGKLRDDEDAAEFRQCVVLTDETINCYNIWEHFFTKEKLLKEIQAAGFGKFELFVDAAGKEFSDTGETICGVLQNRVA